MKIKLTMTMQDENGDDVLLSEYSVEATNETKFSPFIEETLADAVAGTLEQNPYLTVQEIPND
jgi:hypothetical protein